MFCPNCGKEVNADAVICAKCGHKLKNTGKTESDAAKKRFCTHCGHEVNADAAVCMNCGCAVNERKGSKSSNIAIKIFMILGCFVRALYLIPLLWTVPTTVYVYIKLNRGQPIGTGVKVCILIFCNIIAGILLLGDYHPEKDG